MRVGRLGVWVLSVVVIAAIGSVSAYADYGYTDVYAPPPSEATHAEILDDAYGGTFTADGYNFVGSGASEGISALRVYDYDEEEMALHVLNGNQNDIDQIWTDGTVTVTATAKYAWFEQSFGWNQGGTEGTNYKELLNEGHVNNGSVEVLIDGDFLWGSRADRFLWCDPGYEWWSLEAENTHQYPNGEEDHFVTYFIQGLNTNETVWMVFIEDDRFDDSDLDYNDFVIEISAVPEPVTIVLLAVGGLFLRRRKS